MNLKRRYLLLCPAVLLTFFTVLRIRSPGVTHVEGWDRNTSRDIKDYITEKLLPHIMPADFCANRALLLVIVNSKPANFEARNAIRETWAQKRDNVSFFFLLGEVNISLYSSVQSQIEQEGQHFGDIIQERFVDHYNNLTLKSVNMLKLFTIHCSKTHKYLMKIDDDVFLNTDLVVEMLLERKSKRNLLIGKIINDTAPFRDTSSKWFVPYEWYPEEKYPDYLCGPTYVMSADVIQKLYHCALQTPIFYIEDVYVTGICAKKTDVTPQHHKLFTCHYMKGGICRNKHLYSMHYYSPPDIRNSYDILKNNYCSTGLFWVWDSLLNFF